MMALGAIRAAREAGLAVPGDVSVVGFDDSRLVASSSTRRSRPCGSRSRQMGGAAVAALADAIEGRRWPSQEYLFEPELVLRGSTGPARR